MAVGLLLVILGVWIFINGLNGNLSGLLIADPNTGNPKIKINVVPDATYAQPTSIITKSN